MSLDDLGQARPLTAGAARLLADAAGAEASARARIAAAAADIVLPEAWRLSDRTRLRVRDLLGRLIATIEDAIVQHVATALGSHDLGEASGPLACLGLGDSGVLADMDLVAHLLRRADGDSIAAALRHTGGVAATLTDRLIGDEDPAIASAAMGLIAAEDRRRDRFEGAPLARTELPADLQHQLVWRIAVALRDSVVRIAAVPGPAADRALADAAAATLAGHDEGDTLEGRAMTLALLLRARIDDDLIADAVEQGHFALAIAGIAVRAGIAPADAADMAIDPGGHRLALLLRAIHVARLPLARIAVAIAVANGRDPGEAALLTEAADGLDGDEARRVLAPWRLDPAYRRALGELSGGAR